MALKDMNVEVPKQSMIYLMICMSIVLLFILAGIVPLYFYSLNLDRKKAEVTAQIEEQKELLPIYQILTKKISEKASATLPMPARTKLPKNQTDQVPIAVKGIARTFNMDIVYADPDLNALSGESKHLLVNALVKGTFFNFRKFLIGLGGLPYLERIDDVQIKQTMDTLEFKMKLWVAIG